MFLTKISVPVWLVSVFFALALIAIPTTSFANVLNPSFEIGTGNDADNWTPGSFGSSTALLTIATTSLHVGSGNRAAQVEITVYGD